MILIENCAIATVDAAGTEYLDGHVVVGDDGRIEARAERAQAFHLTPRASPASA